MDKNLEIRNLPLGARYRIVQILDVDNSWQRVMDHIPKDLSSDNFERKYNSEHVRLIKQHAVDTNRSCSDVLLDEWGTSGKIRPTIKTLLDVLQKAEVYRAADAVAIMIQEPIPKRPDTGPAREISTNVTLLLNGESMVEVSDVKNNGIDDIYSSQALHNGVTKQMKSVNLIDFATGKDIRQAKSFGKQTTAQMLSNDRNMQVEVHELGTDELPDLPELQDDNANELQSKTEKNSELSQLNLTNSSMYPISVLRSSPSVDLYNSIDRVILDNPNLVQFQYEDLQGLTNNFSEICNETKNGPVGKIGKGGFGDVFAAYHPKYGTLAVKRVRCINQFDCEPDMVIKIFNNEVNSLSHLHHVNIVPILGYSINGPLPCIICKYIEGGNLEQKLAAKILKEKQRMDIIIGTAEGLKYIHNTAKPVKEDPNSNGKKVYFLHGDIKSANILLTTDCIPKLCDFGLAKQLETTFLVSSMMGTSAYMPFEAFNGTITRKTDIYSFGIVILEILTGLRPIVPNDRGEKINIKSYIEENISEGMITSLLDKNIENWPKAQSLYNLSKCCLEMNRNRRPTMDEICAHLQKINEDDSFLLSCNSA